MPGDAALAWCNRDDYGWCGMHNRPFGHCRAEALDTVAAERARIRAAVEKMKPTYWPPANMWATGVEEALSAVLRIIDEP